MSDPVNTPVYMTAKLNLANGTIIYPQISLDNIVRAIDDPTLVTVAETVGGKVPVTELPVVNAVASTGSTANIPTEYAVRALANTKQDTLTGGAGVTIADGTISFNGTTLDVTTIDSTKTNGVFLSLDGSMLSAKADMAANNSAGVIAGATNGVQIDANGYAQFDNATVDAATPEEITGGTAKVIQADGLNTALHLDWETVQMERLAFNAVKCEHVFIGSTTNVHGEITGGTVHCSNFIGSDAGYAGIQWLNSRYSMPKLNKAGKYLVTVEVYNNLTGAEDRVLISGNIGVSILSGIPYYTDAHNTWVKLGVLVTSSGEVAVDRNITFYTRSTATTVDFYMRNLAIMDVTDIPASDYVTVFNNSGYVYKPGDGIEFDADKIQIDNASTLDALNGVGTDGNPLYDRVLTPGNLKSALSIGQAVDCTAVPAKTASISITDDEGTALNLADVYRDSFHAKVASWGGGWVYLGFGGETFTYFYPKAANTADGTPLQYIIMADLENTGSSVVRVNFYVSLADGTDKIRQQPMQYWNYYLQPGEKKRYSCMFWAKMDNGVSKTRAAFSFYRQYGTGDLDVKISNLREFEVMALTDDAVMCLANITDPDDANSLYLLKTDMVSPWTSIINMGSAPAVTLAAGLAYKSTITGGTCTFSTDTCPAGTYGRDAHLTLFVKIGSTIIFQPPLTLIDPLVPGAGHNITIKYRDGQANAYVEDTDIGYVVSVAGGTAEGSLDYGLHTSTSDYIVFSTAVDGQIVTVDNSTISRAVTIIGNGPENTIISAHLSQSAQGTPYTLSNARVTKGISCSGVLSDLLFDGLTDADAWASSTLCVRRNSGAIGTILVVNNCVFRNNSSTEASAILNPSGNSAMAVTGCTFINNSVGTGALINSTYNRTTTLACNITKIENCYFASDNTCSYAVYLDTMTTTSISGCTFGDGQNIHVRDTSGISFTGTTTLDGTVTAEGTITMLNNSVLTSTGGGTIDLTGNTIGIRPNGASNFTLDNLIITGSTITNYNGASNQACIEHRNNADFTITNCILRDIDLSGRAVIALAPDSTANVINITGITMTAITGHTSAYGVTHSGRANMYVENCLFTELNKVNSLYTTNSCTFLSVKGTTVTGSSVATERLGDCTANAKTTYIENCVFPHGVGVSYAGRKDVVINGITASGFGGGLADRGYFHFIAGSQNSFSFIDEDSFKCSFLQASVGSFLDDNYSVWVVGGTAAVNVNGTNIILKGVGTTIYDDGTTDFGTVYTVTAATGTDAGSLYDGLMNNSDPYVLLAYDTETASATLGAAVSDRVVNFATASGDTIVGGTFSLVSGTTVGVDVTKTAEGLIDVTASTVTFTDPSTAAPMQIACDCKIYGTVKFNTLEARAVVGSTLSMVGMTPDATIDFSNIGHFNATGSGATITHAIFKDLTFKNGRTYASYDGTMTTYGGFVQGEHVNYTIQNCVVDHVTTGKQQYGIIRTLGSDTVYNFSDLIIRANCNSGIRLSGSGTLSNVTLERNSSSGTYTGYIMFQASVVHNWSNVSAYRIMCYDAATINISGTFTVYSISVSEWAVVTINIAEDTVITFTDTSTDPRLTGAGTASIVVAGNDGSKTIKVIVNGNTNTVYGGTYTGIDKDGNFTRAE